ncbi:MAG: substrate-binding domain-containing protein [Pyrinomonadaceae bacterium]|nr:substrate-binding domain-containing protein [Pyrinomonadaceae bacterium]
MKLKLLLMLLIAVLAASCAKAPNDQSGSKDPNKKIKIGFSMATLLEERWVRDKEAFEAHCKKMDVECVITVANNKEDKQANDVENLLTQGIDVLVIAPQNATQAASMVEKAKAQGVPVISYDRLIDSDKIDLYISHQVPVIGKKIAEYALEKAPKGNYIMVYGASTDNNAVIMKKAMLEVLQPAIEGKAITIKADQFIEDWKPAKALDFVENALTQNADDIQAVVVSNDGMAGGVISALEKRGLTGKVVVTGQDAQKDALQNIASGKQSMTIYKPIIPLANAAVEAAIKLAKKEPLSDTKPFRNETLKKDVPATLLEVVVVDKNNLMDTVIKDGFASYDDVYANVPQDQRPPKP